MHLPCCATLSRALFRILLCFFLSDGGPNKQLQPQDKPLASGLPTDGCGGAERVAEFSYMSSRLCFRHKRAGLTLRVQPQLQPFSIRPTSGREQRSHNCRRRCFPLFLSPLLSSPGLVGMYVRAPKGKWRTRRDTGVFLLPSASTGHRQTPCRALRMMPFQPAAHERLSCNPGQKSLGFADAP
jgi:hypothetical protein